MIGALTPFLRFDIGNTPMSARLKRTSLRTVLLFVALCLSGCATCQQHPVMCGVAVMALTTGAVYVATQNSSNTLQQYCRVLPDGAVRCGRAP